ncbi:MAG TPA: protease modulator HflK, partial [Candidatus Hydrogenedentes bacterium]|nr:protease modulator HflK [Candidatus Hydrogenedentota bacterium]
RIGDPRQYVFCCRRPEMLVKCAAEQALTDTAVCTHVDDLLTSGKHLVLAQVKRQCQEKLRAWEVGIEIISANFASVYPPAAVSEAFKDVASALEDRDRIVNEARGDQSETIHRARGAAQKEISEATALSKAKVNRAQGETARFLAVLEEYRQSGKSEASITRLYIETMEEVLAEAEKYLIDPPRSAEGSARRGVDDANH